MMKSVVTVLSVCAIVMLASCNHGGSTEKVRVKNSVSIRGMNTSYFYNPDGTIAYTTSSKGEKTTYAYGANKVAVKMTDTIRQQSMGSTFFLDGKGYADSTTAKDETGSYLKTYAHDESGHITGSKDFSQGSVTNISSSVIVDGNEVSTTISDSTNKKLFTVYFDYFTDKTNTLGYENFGMKFLGNDSKNPMKKFVQVLAAGDTLRSSTFNYHYDDMKRITAKIMYDSHGMMRDSVNYLYY